MPRVGVVVMSNLRALGIGIVFLSGCDLVDYVPVVPVGSVNVPAEPLAVTANGDHVWMADTEQSPPFAGPPRLVLADRHDGSVVLTLGPFASTRPPGGPTAGSPARWTTTTSSSPRTS